MADAPGTREELRRALVSECGLVAEEVLDAIEALNLRIVPAEPTTEMRYAGVDVNSPYVEKIWGAMIAANPFAQEQPND